SSTSFDLETFTHSPMDDNFGPLPSQAVPNNNYLNEQFLLLWHDIILADEHNHMFVMETMVVILEVKEEKESVVYFTPGTV
ncbi:MAG: hypothetical protein J3R72DRAFT_369508, partial [Linnemannia gamsii]